MPSFDSLVELFATHPYLGVIAVFVMCGVGLPIPEEIILVLGGYLCYLGHAVWVQMMAACALGIASGDVIPFLLGRVFGPKLLRLRLMRLIVNRQRLFLFDRWFRRRGDMVIVIARFVPGLRVVAFFTAATMHMRLRRFVTLDFLGIAVVVPLFTWIGKHFGPEIQQAIRWIQRVEKGILIASIVAGCVVGVLWWLRRRRKRKALLEVPADTYVGRSPEATHPDPVAPDGEPPAKS